MSRRTILIGLLLMLIAAGVLAWVATPRHGVVVYTSVDEHFAKELATRFEKATGIPVTLRPDSEVSKTTGLIGRLRDLKSRPDGDVFWNSELSATLLLAKEGILAPYTSPNAKSIPDLFKDRE